MRRRELITLLGGWESHRAGIFARIFDLCQIGPVIVRTYRLKSVMTAGRPHLDSEQLRVPQGLAGQSAAR
jgi:hypothetical protein